MTKPWVNVAMARSQLQASAAPSEIATCELDKYVRFVHRSSQLGFRFLSLKMLITPLAVFLPALLISGAFAQSSRGVTEPMLAFSVVLVGVTYGIAIPALIHGLIKHRRSFKIKSALLISEDLLTGLCSRTAREPKDMAYGMWAVLERGGIGSLPKPDYSANTGDVFKTFTIHIMQMTQSVEPLLLAALKGLPGQPSWVPDWTAHHILRHKKPRRRRGKLVASLIFPTYSNLERKLEEKVRGRFTLTEDGTVLKIQGSEIGHITLVARFADTHMDYLDAEKNAHLQNLHLILDYNLLVHLEINKRLTSPTAKEVSAWVSFCRRHSGRSLNNVLGSLRQRPKIFRTHVLMCKILIGNEQAAFRAVYSGQHGYSSSGFCSVLAEAGHHIVRFEGLSTKLVVRTLDFSATSVNIVGLVHNWSKTTKSSHEDCRPPLVEYHIH